MGTTHRLKFDAYQVGDSLLDGVSFAVLIEVNGTDATVLDVIPWDVVDAEFMENLNFEKFKEHTRQRVQRDIAHLSSYYKENGLTFEEDMAAFEAETGEPGIQVIAEV